MCGIAGVTNGNQNTVEKMSAALFHRGPDQSGVYKQGRVVFGQQRLSIIGIAPSGKQPMVSDDGKYILTYNGEIYNYKELKNELQTGGCVFKTETDTEVVLQGYIKEGVRFFNKMRGMWAFALYDVPNGKIILSRDQFGIKPLYYTEHGNTLSFASELKALRQLGIPITPNTDEYYTFFNLGYFISPHTCVRDVYTVEPGQIITYDLEGKYLTKDTLCIKSTPVSFLESEEQVIEKLHEALLDSIRMHYVSDVPVGILFSGGTESSLVASLSKQAGYTPRAYHLAVKGSNDLPYVEKISAHLGLEVDLLQMTNKEINSQYEEMWETLDVPFGDLSLIPTLCIFKHIQGKSKVVLSGEGGDEYFGGYKRQQPLAKMRTMKEHNYVLAVFNGLVFSSRHHFPFASNSINTLRSLYLKYFADDVIGMYIRGARIFDYPFKVQKLRKKLFSLYEEQKDSQANLFFDRQLYLRDNLLYKDDIASMAYGIEARVPFVDKVVDEFIRSSIPEDMVFSTSYREKYLLKKVLEKYLPTDLVYRKKSGFSFKFDLYQIPSFYSDLQAALVFHKQHADLFEITNEMELLDVKLAENYMLKNPRFAFALVSNWRMFR
jgi:asparagine synthase (glutamine-hydrolysing)